MAQRLAENGYFVVLPDLFHRSQPYTTEELRNGLFDPAKRAAMREKFFPAMETEKATTDVKVILDYLATRSDVRQGRYGTTGYCMGGNLSLCAAGRFPDQIVASASFHGGNLASDAPNSPHLLAPATKAELYIAGAIEDSSFPDDMKQRLEDSLTAAKVDHVIETYPARHGFAVADLPVYDEACCERHWSAMLGLFARHLKG